jgi:hypothetical protein
VSRGLPALPNHDHTVAVHELRMLQARILPYYLDAHFKAEGRAPPVNGPQRIVIEN